jgi:nucleotide-binding universal stress UspA family protein
MQALRRHRRMEIVMFKKIIVAVDMAQVDKGVKILKKAEALADTGGEIVLLNVVEDIPGYLAIDVPGHIIEKNRQTALETLDKLRAEIKVRTSAELRTGQAASNILAAAEAHDADLIMVASHRPDISNYFLGSTADRVVRHAGISVLVDR